MNDVKCLEKTVVRLALAVMGDVDVHDNRVVIRVKAPVFGDLVAFYKGLAAKKGGRAGQGLGLADLKR